MNRRNTFALPAVPNPRGHLLVATAALIFLAGKFGADFFLQRASLVILSGGLILVFWGSRRLRTLTFPLLLLTAAIPLPAVLHNDLSQQLQLLASAVSARLAQLCGTAISREGNILRLQGFSLGVEEACNGLSSIFALALTGALLTRYYCRQFTGVLLVPCGVILGVAVNIVRITLTAILAGHDRRFAAGFYHIFSGWLVFLIGFILLILLARVLAHYGTLDSCFAVNSNIDNDRSGEPSRRHAEISSSGVAAHRDR